MTESNLVEINARLVGTASRIVERTYNTVTVAPDERWLLELVLRLQGLTHLSMLSGYRNAKHTLENITGGDPRAIQAVLDFYIELRLNGFSNVNEWSQWIDAVSKAHVLVRDEDKECGILPEELRKALDGRQQEFATTLMSNPWLLVFYTFPQLNLNVRTGKLKQQEPSATA